LIVIQLVINTHKIHENNYYDLPSKRQKYLLVKLLSKIPDKLSNKRANLRYTKITYSRD